MTDFFRYIKYDNNISLQILSKRYGVPICMILNANNAKSDIEFTGKEKIIMPYPCYCERYNTCILDNKDSAHNFNDKNHIVTFKDYNIGNDTNIFDIAKKTGLTESVIIRLNKLFNPNDIKKGMILKIPIYDFNTFIYQVKPAESLDDIAKKFNNSIDEIIDINMLSDEHSIYASMKLILARNES